MTGGTLFGLDPRNTDYPPAGGLIEVERKEPADAMVMALQNSRDPRAADWRQELPLLDPISLPLMVARTAIRNQFGNLYWESPNWRDTERNIEWTFSHDRMLYLGRDPQSGQERGVWGIGGVGDKTPFPEIPVAFDNQFLLTRHVLYAIDAQERRQHEVLRLPMDEQFISVEQKQFQRMLILTDRQLRVYRPDRTSASTYAPWLIDWQMALPRGAQYLMATQVVQLMDGWLVSFLYGDGFRQVGFEQFSMLTRPQQQTFFIDEDGQPKKVAERLLSDDYPAFYRVNWWVSPVLHLPGRVAGKLDRQGARRSVADGALAFGSAHARRCCTAHVGVDSGRLLLAARPADSTPQASPVAGELCIARVAGFAQSDLPAAKGPSRMNGCHRRGHARTRHTRVWWMVLVLIIGMGPSVAGAQAPRLEAESRRQLDAALAAAVTRPPSSMIARADFLQNPTISEVQLAADGGHVSFVRSNAGQFELWLRDLRMAKSDDYWRTVKARTPMVWRRRPSMVERCYRPRCVRNS